MTQIPRTILILVVLLAGFPGCASKPPVGTTADRPLVGYPGQNPDLMRDRGTVWSAHKIGRSEYFAQPNDWTCNASSYIMIFRALTGKDIALDGVVKRMGAVKGKGAENSRVVQVLQALGDDYEVITAITSSQPKGKELPDAVRAAEKVREMATLKRLLREGYAVTINFREPEEGGGHYGVLQGINDRAIEIADPYYGLRSVLEWDRFDFRTGYSDPVLHGWYVAVRPKQNAGPTSDKS